MVGEGKGVGEISMVYHISERTVYRWKEGI
jgi:hypothetical protein